MATATDIGILEAQKREPGNKNAARRVRAGGKIPPWSTARARTRLRSRSIRGRCCAFCARRAATTRFRPGARQRSGEAMIVDWQFEPIKGTLSMSTCSASPWTRS